MTYTCLITSTTTLYNLDLCLDGVVIESANSTKVALDYYLSILGSKIALHSFFKKLPVGVDCKLEYVN